MKTFFIELRKVNWKMLSRGLVKGILKVLQAYLAKNILDLLEGI